MSKISINRRKLDEIIGGIEGFIGDVAQDARENIRDEARERVPVDTGYLRDHIEVQRDTVVADADYAGFVEFGTRHMAPRPFLVPAYNKVLADIDRIAAARFRKVFGGS